LSLYPLDRNAYATVLRSPFVRLGDESIFKILLENPDTPFPDEYSDLWFDNSAEKSRFEHGKRVFDTLKARIDLNPIASILSFLWFETGYRTAMLFHQEYRPNLGHFQYLYTLALNADQRQMSVSAFLDELAPLIGTTEKTETGETPEVENEILFLTVHKSKGLEFPVVILADSGGVGQGERNSAPYYYSKIWGPIINMKMDTQKRDESAVNYFYELIKDDIQKQEEAETKRLFYVAATRAERKLLIFGSKEVGAREESALSGLENEERLDALLKTPHITGKGEDQRVVKKSFLDLLAAGFEGWQNNGAEYEVFPIHTPDYAEYRVRIRALREKTERLLSKQKADSPIPPEIFYRKSGGELPPAKTLFTTPSAIQRFADQTFSYPANRGWAEPLPAFQCDRFLKEEEDRLNFGVLCHRFIEKMLADAGFSEDRGVRDLFPEAGADQVNALTAEASLLARRFLESPLGREASEAVRRASEFPFFLPLLEKGEKPFVLIQGQIDLIYEHNDQCVVVDFKTDREARPESHRFQMACYQKAASAFSSLPVRVELVYLRNMEARLFNLKTPEEELFTAAGESASFHSIL
jgi:ATP-dependent helicase/nuclease subunit A